MLKTGFSEKFLLLLFLLLISCEAQCPKEIPFGKLSSSCMRQPNERCTFTCLYGYKNPNFELTLSLATCSLDYGTFKYTWNIPDACKESAAAVPSLTTDDHLSALLIVCGVIGSVTCFMLFVSYAVNRIYRCCRGRTFNQPQRNPAISGSGDGVQNNMFALTNDQPNEDHLSHNRSFSQNSLQTSVRCSLTDEMPELVEPPKYSKIDFSEKTSPPSYTEAIESLPL